MSTCDVCNLLTGTLNYEKFHAIYKKLDVNGVYYIEDPFDEEFDTHGGYSYHDAIKFTRREWHDTNPDKYYSKISKLMAARTVIKKKIHKEGRKMSKEEASTFKVLGQAVKYYRKMLEDIEEVAMEGLEVQIVQMQCEGGSTTFVENWNEKCNPFLIQIKKGKLYSKHELHLDYREKVDTYMVRFMKKFLE